MHSKRWGCATSILRAFWSKQRQGTMEPCWPVLGDVWSLLSTSMCQPNTKTIHSFDFASSHYHILAEVSFWVLEYLSVDPGKGTNRWKRSILCSFHGRSQRLNSCQLSQMNWCVSSAISWWWTLQLCLVVDTVSVTIVSSSSVLVSNNVNGIIFV